MEHCDYPFKGEHTILFYIHLFALFAFFFLKKCFRGLAYQHRIRKIKLQPEVEAPESLLAKYSEDFTTSAKQDGIMSTDPRNKKTVSFKLAEESPEGFPKQSSIDQTPRANLRKSTMAFRTKYGPLPQGGA